MNATANAENRLGREKSPYLLQHAENPVDWYPWGPEALERAQADSEERFRLRRRIDELTPLWREARELAVLTAHYYDRSYHKDEKYTL